MFRGFNYLVCRHVRHDASELDVIQAAFCATFTDVFIDFLLRFYV